MSHTTDPNDADLHEKDSNNQNKKYLILSEEERAKGFVRPVRTKYVHVTIRGGCGVLTQMSEPIAETYARDPKFYGRTFCVGCGDHFPVSQFVWAEGLEDETVGS